MTSLTNFPLADLAQLTAALMDGLQRDRLLRLHTPLDAQYGPDTLIPEHLTGLGIISPHTSRNGNEDISGYRFTLVAVSHQSDIPLSPALGQPIVIEPLTAQPRDELPPYASLSSLPRK